MMNQATSIIAEALLYSLLAGAATYIVLRLLLALLKNIPALIKYHLCNISLLIPLLIFIVSLTQFTTIRDTASVYPTPPPVANIYNHVQPTTVEPQHTPVQDEKLTAEMLWAKVHSAINENSQAITWLYIAGLLLFSARLLLQYRQSQQLKTKGLLPATDDWHRLLANTMLQLNITNPIHIAFTERKISPCIIGHAKAVILVPISLVNHLTTEQAEAILLHELAHYKQYDHYINLGVQCVKCILFFNPFVWLTAILIDKYRELSCDETATRHERNIELAETLALIAGMQARQNSLVMSLKKRSPLLARVQALLHIRQYDKSSHRLLPAIVTTIILATGLLIAGSTQLFSTEKDNLHNQLKDISAQMYKEGNHKYVFVDAVLDSLIKLPAKADVLYMGSQYFSIMGDKGEVRLTTQQRERYIKKLQLFLLSVDEDKETPVTYDAIAGKGTLTMQDVLSKESTFRTYTVEERYRAGIAKQGWKKVFAELVQDKLVQGDTRNFSMKYSGKGITINGWKLEGAQESKYISMLKEVVGIDLQKVSGSLSQDDMQRYLGVNGKNSIEDINALAEVSRLLFAEGKIEYILADAMKDGYLRDGDEFTIVMNENDVLFAGVKMTKEQETQYNDKYRLFKEYYACPDCHGGVTATIRYSDLVNQNSALREGDFLLTVNSNLRQEKTMLVLSEMHEDGLIDTNYRVDIFYIGESFAVNTANLSKSEAGKYVKLLKKYSLTGKNDNGEDTWSIVMNHDKPYAPSDLAQIDYNQFRILPKKEKAQVLEYISNDLFNKGLTDYMMVDAVKDGYLKDGERYDIRYKDGVVSITGITLSVADQIAYNNKLEQFIQHFESKGWYGSTRSTVKLADILDPGSRLRTRERTTNTAKEEQPFSALIMGEMASDGLINMAYQVKIECSDTAIWVNNKKLTGADYEKYRAMYKRAYPGKGEKCYNLVQFNTDHPFPPDNNTGAKTPEQQSPDELIDDLFRKGYQGFIIAELVRDGYIKKGDQYKLSYKRGKFSIEGKQLPGKVIKHYENRMAEFVAAYPETASVSWSVEDEYKASGTKEDFNVKLTGGSRTESEREKERLDKEREENFNKMLQAMDKDGLLDINSYYLMEYKKDGLYVNAIKLTGSKEKKYTNWLHEMGYTAGKGFLTERIPDGVKIPDRRTENSVISMPVYGNNLPALAQLMFVDGNPNFILAHALQDGVLRERQNFNFRFTGSETYFNDKLLPAPYQSKYTKLMNDFMAAHKQKSKSYSMRGDGITKKILNTPESAIRKDRINKGRDEKGEFYVQRVIKMMAADGLIDTTQKHSMKYNYRGVFVNGKKLSDEQAAKYEPILKEGFGRSPRWTHSDEVSYSNEP